VGLCTGNLSEGRGDASTKNKTNRVVCTRAHPPETHTASRGKLSLFCAVGLCVVADTANL